VIILGDVTDTEATREQEAANVRAVAAVLEEAALDTVCLMGNHDAFVFTESEFYALLGEKYRPHPIDEGDVHLLFLDACYYGSGEHYHPEKSHDWTDTAYPHTQALAQDLQAREGTVYVFMHQNIDPEIPEDHRLANAAEVRAVLEQSGRVKAVYQGHCHWGNRTEVNGIRYITLPAMCESEGAYHVIELV